MPEYGPGARKGNRLQVTTVAYDDGGAAEVFWARSADIITMEHEGSFVLCNDGSAWFKFWSDDEVPYVLHVLGNRVVVAMTENVDSPPHVDTIVFDSNEHSRKEVNPDA